MIVLEKQIKNRLNIFSVHTSSEEDKQPDMAMDGFIEGFRCRVSGLHRLHSDTRNLKSLLVFDNTKKRIF